MAGICVLPQRRPGLAAIGLLFALTALPPSAGADRLILSASPSATPTFHCIGLTVPYQGDENADSACTPCFRLKGESAWREGYPLFADREAREFRGSLVNLQSGALYEIELRFKDPDGVSPRDTAVLSAQTWSEEFPIQQTVWIEPGVRTQPLVIDRSGSPRGYVLYSARPGREQATLIEVRGKADANVVITGSYVIVRGLTLKNAAINGIEIQKAHHVVIERCEITGWGRLRNRETTGDLDAAVYARNGGAQIVVQDCVIKLPRSYANDWSKGHPAGPQAISLIETDGNHVIRYNALTSDDAHRYNDVLGGGWNFGPKGAPCRDTDIYGNLLSHCHDDAIEADGQNINVRIWGNRIEKAYCGISLAPVIKGPTYVWRNVITDVQSAGFKLGEGDRKGYGAVYLYHNTVFLPNAGPAIADYGGQRLFRHTASRNNILIARSTAISDRRADPTNSYGWDLLAGRVDGTARGVRNAVSGDPAFVNAADGVFLLTSRSAALNRGVVIAGFNEGFRGPAPDLGAFEQGDEPPRYGPRDRK